jgi:hypothetical protein
MKHANFLKDTNYKEIGNLGKSVSIKEIESIINNLLKQKVQKFKEEIYTSTINFFLRMDSEKIIPNPFYKASITLTPKPDQNIVRKLQPCTIDHEHLCKSPPQIIGKLNSIM